MATGPDKRCSTSTSKSAPAAPRLVVYVAGLPKCPYGNKVLSREHRGLHSTLKKALPSVALDKKVLMSWLSVKVYLSSILCWTLNKVFTECQIALDKEKSS
jgi:hypothetical protein